MFKIASERAVKEFASDNERWDANSTLMDSTKIRLLAVAVESPAEGIVGRMFRRTSTFIHDTTFTQIAKAPADSDAKEKTMTPVTAVIGEFDSTRKVELDANVKAEFAQLFDVSVEGVRSVTETNDFGKLHKRVLREQQLIEYFNAHLMDTKNPLIQQLTKRTGVTVYVVSGVASIEGDSHLTYKLNMEGSLSGGHDGSVADISGSASGDSSQTKDLFVPDGTVMMYKLTKVKIDKNSGKVNLVLLEDAGSCWEMLWH